MLEDFYLITRMQQNDETALHEVIERYKSYVYVIVNQIIGSAMQLQDIEEVCNDVFYKLWSNAEKISIEKGNLKVYLASIARNTAKNKLRDLKLATVPIQDNDVIEIPDPFEHMEKQEISLKINNALNFLNPQERSILVKYYYYYEPIPKISKEIGIGKNTIKSILKRGREKLEKYLIKGGL